MLDALNGNHYLIPFISMNRAFYYAIICWKLAVKLLFLPLYLLSKLWEGLKFISSKIFHKGH